MNFKRILTVAAVATLASTAQAGAQAFTGPVASNAYITFGGLDWAWASPCAAVGGCDGFNISGADGTWRFANDAEWAGRPVAADFLSSTGNFYGDAGLMACASGWFSLSYTHCDYSNGLAGTISSGPGEVGSTGGESYDETWIVRGDVVATPEPASVALLATGLVGIIGFARRRKA